MTWIRWAIGVSAGIVFALAYGSSWFFAGLLWPVVLHLVDAFSQEMRKDVDRVDRESRDSEKKPQ